MITIRQTPKGVLVPLKVTPRGGKNCVLPYAEGDDRVRVKVSAPPEDGKANAAVIALFSELLDVSKRQVSIASGETARMKMLLVNGVDVEKLVEKLIALLENADAVSLQDF